MCNVHVCVYLHVEHIAQKNVMNFFDDLFTGQKSRVTIHVKSMQITVKARLGHLGNSKQKTAQ